jgi:tRNA threonylcarbamoyladenosine biosynthesis protein TsaE
MDIVFTLDELDQAVARLWDEGKQHRVWALHGQMGAGKTTLVARLCRFLSVIDPASSPTFSLINEYRLPDGGILCHMDWYRLKDREEAIQAGVDDRIWGDERCLIEWPERAADLLPADTFHISLTVVDANTRRLSTD